MSTAMQGWPRRHRISVDHFYRMADAGLFTEDDRVELIDGEIVEMPPMGSRHASVLQQLASLLTSAVGKRAIVRQQLPLRLAEYSEPLPDIAVVATRDDYYSDSHPRGPDTWLAVEIGESTLRYDLDVKSSLYARSGVPELWVLDAAARRVHDFRSPLEGRYTDVQTSDYGRLPIRAAGNLSVDLATLVG